MSSTVTQTSTTQTFIAPTDSLSTSTANAGLCGSFTYIIIQGYSFLTINSSTLMLNLSSSNMSDIGTYSATLSASLTNYPSVPTVMLNFSVMLVDPCLTTVLNLPTVL